MNVYLRLGYARRWVYLNVDLSGDEAAETAKIAAGLAKLDVKRRGKWHRVTFCVLCREWRTFYPGSDTRPFARRYTHGWDHLAMPAVSNAGGLASDVALTCFRYMLMKGYERGVGRALTTPEDFIAAMAAEDRR